MAPPSKLAIATGSLKRLIKEEASYHKELSQQEARIKQLEAGSEDENAEFQLKQEVHFFHIFHIALPLSLHLLSLYTFLSIKLNSSLAYFYTMYLGI